MGVHYAEVIGDPIAHSKSPIIHKFWLEKLGRAAEYRRQHVRPGGLADYLADRRRDPWWRGCNVTIPHKQTILRMLDEAVGDAREAGAVNVVIRSSDGLIGTNTDVPALRRDLLGWADEASVLAMPVVVFGAGGAARAVCQVLREVEEVEVVILNRDVAKAEALLDAFHLNGRILPLGAALPAAHVIVNASSLGMTGFPPLPLDPEALESRPFVYELVYEPVETDLLRQARARGCPALDGLTMLIEQARGAFELFFSSAPPLGVEAELRELLVR